MKVGNAALTLACWLMACATAMAGPTTTLIVPSTAGPWDAALNPGFPYTFSYAGQTQPITVGSAGGFSFDAGSLITVSHVSGTVSAGAGYAFWDANGDPNNLTNNIGPNSAFPAFYMNPAVPVYGQALVGTFANNGVIVGQPFVIGNGPTTLTVPTGANQLLLGVNDNFYGDNVGAFTVTVSEPFSVCLLYNPTRAVNSGNTVPIKLQLCDVNGSNVSSGTIALHAVGVLKASDAISGPVQDAGNANPDNDFRFDPALGGTGGFIFNLKTTGLTTGSYTLTFTVPGDSFVYAAPFQVR
jgi:hypothetical protein